MPTLTFEQLNEGIATADINRARMTDIKTGVYHIEIGEVAGKPTVALVSDSKKRVVLNPENLNSLAAMRIVEDEKAAQAVKTTRDARESADYKTLQDAMAAAGSTVTKDSKFKVVHQLSILDSISDAPVYKNTCYAGYTAYLKACKAAAKLTGSDRNNAFNDATAALRETKLNAGVKDDQKVMMPVFQVTF
jgi:hypothetical protein